MSKSGSIRGLFTRLSIAVLLFMPTLLYASMSTVNGYTWTWESGTQGREICNNYGMIDVDTGQYVPSISPDPVGVVTIPDAIGGKNSTAPVRILGSGVFSCCSNMTGVVIPDSVRRIRDKVFYRCSSLTTISIPNSVTNIGKSVFYGCTKLQEVTISENAQCLGASIFAGCSNLTTVTIPPSVKSIENYSFYKCSSLKNIEIPFGITNIGYQAFFDCAQLSTITIPDTVIRIADSVFKGCSQDVVDIMTIPGIEIVDGWVVGNTGMPVESLDITGLRGVCDGAFSGCYGLAYISLPDCLTRIGDNTFLNCDKLSSISIPKSVTTIGVKAFYGCCSLGEVVIPRNITSIGSAAFAACDNLNIVFIPNTYGGTIDGVFSPTAEIYRYSPTQNVSFNLSEGVGTVDPITVNYNEEYGELPTSKFSRAGYTFGGWELNGVRIHSDSIVLALDNHTLTAQWLPNSYAISFDSNGGTENYAERDVLFGAEYGDLPNPSYFGHSFGGWFCNGNRVKSNTIVLTPSNHVLTAHWAVNKYPMTFNANGGNGGCTLLQEYDTPVVAPDVTRLGYSLAGWQPSILTNVPAEALEFVAQWRANQYTVTFDANGGIGEASLIQDCDTEFVAPFMSRIGYELVGWSPELPTLFPPSNSTYIAQWKPQKYEVVFDANGGLGSVTNEQDYASEIVAPEVSREGYTFVGWLPEVDVTVPASNVTYTAQWRINQYAVVFDANGGAGGRGFVLDYGAEITPPMVMREGCTFEGWMPDVAATVPASNVTYIAKWKVWSVAVDSTDVSLRMLYPDDYDNITNVVLGSGVTNIPNGFFDGCMNLKVVSIPDSVTNIADYAFAGCTNLQTEVWDGYRVLDGWLIGYTDKAEETIPDADKLKGICSEALKGCTALRRLEFGDNSRLVSIGAEALKGCTELKTLVLPPSLTRIGDEAFMGCSYLDNVIVPGGVKSIGNRAFKSCISFTWAQIEHGVESIGEEAFYGCWRITKADVPSSVSATGVNAFGGDSLITKVALRGDVRKMSEIFSSYSQITEATVKSADGAIVDGLFSGCQNLITVWFIGNCPRLANNGQNLYANTSENLATYVGKDSTGWDGMDGSHALPMRWPLVGDHRREIRYYEEITRQYMVRFDANGGSGGWSRTMDYGVTITAPTVTRTGYTFVGWLPAVPATVPASNVTYVAQWTKISDPETGEVLALFEEVDGAAPSAAASEYNGYLVDDAGNTKGTIQVKVGKPNVRTGLATVKATVQLGAKKVPLKTTGSIAVAADGPTAIGLVVGEPCTIMLGSDGLSGFYGGYDIDGSRNFFASKNKAELSAANAVLGKWLGGVSILADVGNFTVTISAKGKAKVTGTLANGKKATGNAVFLVGEEWACVPVVLPKANVSFALWLPLDGGEVVVSGLGDDVMAGRGGALKSGAAFRIDADEFAAVTGIDALPCRPDGVSVEPKGAKWVVAGGAKAGKVMYKRGTQEVDESKLGENPSGLKLTYKKADGSFNGSFKVYAEVKGRLKATTVNVSGIVLNGVGYGTATVKGKGSVAVTIDILLLSTRGDKFPRPRGKTRISG